MIAEFLLLAVPGGRVGMRSSILLPVIRIANSPFSGTVAAYLAVFRIVGDLLAVVLSPATPLADRFATHRLARLKLRRLKGFVAIAAASFPHYRCVALRLGSQDGGREKRAKMAVLFPVEIGSPPGFRNCCRVHTASPPMSSTSKPAAMRVFYPGADNRLYFAHSSCESVVSKIPF